jgi:hypothetical protein
VSTDVKTAAAPEDPRRRRERSLAIFGGVVVVLGVVFAAALMSGARVSSATMGLLAATGALLLSLRALYRLAGALTRPGIETVLDQEALLGVASQRELREEKRRLVRALNELTFDHEMGKLSAADYEAVKERYQLQAVEVMRALENDRDLHPDLAAELSRLAGQGDAEPEAEPSPEPSPATDSDADPQGEPAADAKSEAREAGRACASCDTTNDVDARFCKQCGAALGGEGA